MAKHLLGELSFNVCHTSTEEYVLDWKLVP